MKDKIREWFLKDKEKDELFSYWILRKKIGRYCFLGEGSIKEIEMQINWIYTIENLIKQKV